MTVLQDSNSIIDGGSTRTGPDPLIELRSALVEVVASVTYFLASKQDETLAHKTRRENIISSTNRLLLAARDPAGQWRDVMVNITQAGAIRLFYDWKVFDKIPQQGTISYGALAKGVEAEVSLIRRLSGILVATGVLEQVGSDQISHTARSLIFTRDDPAGAMYEISSYGALSFTHAPAFFEKYGRKEPEGPAPVPSTFAYGHPEMDHYELISSDPSRLKRFFAGMEEIERYFPTRGTYDFGWLTEKAQAEPKRTVLVDVGCGKGHSMAAILQEFPGLPPSRCVLQDRDEVIKAVEDVNDEALSPVEKMAIDFNTEQPVKGAMAYWIRRCLHNYSDTIAINILRILADAMHDDSRLLIVDEIKDNPPSTPAASTDMIMLAIGGKERTRVDLEWMTAKAGLKINSIGDGVGSWGQLTAIECVRAQRADVGSGAGAEVSAE